MAAAKPIELVVITPERKVLETAADEVVIPMHDGELGVLSGRAPLLCELGIGQCRYTHGGQTWRMFIDGGFAQVLDNHVTVLTTQALPAENIKAETIAAAERAVQEHQGVEPDTRLAYERAQRRLSVLRRLHVGS